MAKRQTESKTRTKSSGKSGVATLLAALGAMFFSFLACSMGAYLLLDNSGVFDMSTEQADPDQTSLAGLLDPLDAAYCRQLLNDLLKTPGADASSISIPVYERCRQASPKLFGEVLAHTVGEAERLWFSNNEPFHLWWQGRVLVAESLPIYPEQYSLRSLLDNVTGATEIVWGNCLEQPNYPSVSITTVVVYSCPYLGHEQPFQVVVFEPVEGQWVTDLVTYESEKALAQRFGQGNRSVCPVFLDTIVAYGNDEETIEFLCEPFRR